MTAKPDWPRTSGAPEHPPGALQPLPAGATAPLRALAERAMRSHGLAPHIPPAAQAQAQRAAAQPVAAGLADGSALPWISIDNDDSQDLDQLSAIEPLPGGVMRLNVAVADVAALVRLGDAVDAHAALNAVTVYTDAGLFSMLPTVLSHARTSLVPGVLREALVVSLQVAANGACTTERILRARVQSLAKLAYPAVAEWLAHPSRPLPVAAPAGEANHRAIAEQLVWHDEVATRLHAARARAGALLLDTEELEAVYNAGGGLVDWRARVPNRAQGVIAEIMIAANQALAAWLAERGAPHLLRVLPPPKHWARLRALAAEQGGALPEEPDAPALAAWLAARRQAEPARFADLSLQVVKMLGGGAYAVSKPAPAPGAAPRPNGQLGHFALAAQSYTHATAPNRRYADLITHRQVHALLAGEPLPYDAGLLAQWASHCTRQDGAAAKVARQVRKAAMAMMLEGCTGCRYTAIVTGASPKAVYVRTRAPLIEGRLVAGFEGLQVGDALTVQLAQLNAEQGHIDFVRAP